MVELPSDVPDLVLQGRLVTGGAVVPDGLVAIAGERIVWVGPAADAPDASWPASQVVGTTCCPG